MRRRLPFLITALVVACYLGVAGVGVAPYYTAVSGFISSATNNSDAGSNAPTSTTAQVRAAKTATLHHPVAVKPAATPLPLAVQIRLRNEARVRSLARSAHPPTGRVNILVLGSDNDTKVETAKSPDTQVMIVLSFDTISHTLTILSIPRDFWVRIPGYGYNIGPDGTVGWSKIDVAAGLGFDSAACAVEYNFQIPIQHWVWVGLKGFTGVVNTVQGVTLDVTYPLIDDVYPDDLAGGNAYAYRRLYIPPGPQHLNGDDALRYVRSRHGDVQGDFARSARQQVLLTQLRRVLLTQDGSALVALAPSLFNDLSHEVKTDLSPDLGTAVTYYQLLRSVGGSTPKQAVLQPPTYSTPGTEIDVDPRHGGSGVNGGYGQSEYTVEPNWPAIDAEIKTLFGGQYFNFAHSHCAKVPGAKL